MSDLSRLFGHHLHKNNDPWAGAPPPVIEVREMLRHIITIVENTQRQVMALKDIADDLETQITGMSSVIDGGKVLLVRLAEEVAALAGDATDQATRVRLQGFAQTLKDKAADFSVAIATGTKTADDNDPNKVIPPTTTPPPTGL